MITVLHLHLMLSVSVAVLPWAAYSSDNRPELRRTPTSDPATSGAAELRRPDTSGPTASPEPARSDSDSGRPSGYDLLQDK